MLLRGAGRSFRGRCVGERAVWSAQFTSMDGKTSLRLLLRCSSSFHKPIKSVLSPKTSLINVKCEGKNRFRYRPKMVTHIFNISQYKHYGKRGMIEKLGNGDAMRMVRRPQRSPKLLFMLFLLACVWRLMEHVERPTYHEYYWIKEQLALEPQQQPAGTLAWIAVGTCILRQTQSTNSPTISVN